MKNVFVFIVLMVGVVFGAQAVTNPATYAAQMCAPGNAVYYGKTLSGGKEVLICSAEHDLIYSFGKVGKTPELTFHAPIDKVFKDVEEDNTQSAVSVLIPHGNVSYEVGHTTDLMTGDETDYLRVYNADKKMIANIALDSDTAINDIRNQLPNHF